MITKIIIKELMKEQEQFFLETQGCYPREVLTGSELKRLIFKTKEIIVIAGVRRCGKSILMRLVWDKIKTEKNLDDNQFLYINFEDERLAGFKSTDLNLLLESYYELKEPDDKKQIFLFFDEIQNVAGWEKFLNRLRENKNYKIFVSGSNATLLSKEIFTHLTGRNILINLYPFSFREYILLAKGISFKKNDIYTLDKKARLVKLFDEYMRIGGFPEVISTGYKPLLQEYFKNIIYRDIVVRYKVRHEAGLREIANFLISNIGNILSLKKISNMTGIKNLSTVKNYLEYLRNSFLFYFISLYSYSIKQQIYNPDKMYVCDLGIYNEMSFRFSENKGKILENVVFLELIKKDNQLFYGISREYGEVDFIVCKNNKVNRLIQCCYDISSEMTKEREINALLKAISFYSLKEGYIYTYDYEGEETYKDKKVIYLPVWKFCLFG